MEDELENKSSDESISEEEDEDNFQDEHKISISALVTSLQDLKPKRKIPKKNKDIFAEWGNMAKKVEKKSEDVIVIKDNEDKPIEAVSSELPKVPNPTPVKKRTAKKKTETTLTPRRSSRLRK